MGLSVQSFFAAIGILVVGGVGLVVACAVISGLAGTLAECWGMVTNRRDRERTRQDAGYWLYALAAELRDHPDAKRALKLAAEELIECDGKPDRKRVLTKWEDASYVL